MATPTHTMPHPSASHRWCDSIRATLATAFAPARTLVSWADPPMVLPGFQIHAVDGYVMVRAVQPRDGDFPLRRAHAHAMIARYRRVLRAHGWQVDVVDPPRALPYLRCAWLAVEWSGYEPSVW